ncbi:MAG: serine/threonine protein kinase [Anaerolineae bacterium]|nr:serine/threonine protein kinase [Anaerolineae bacterium]
MSFDQEKYIGPYKIEGKLGQGGMATVYKAYHLVLDRYVAIKVMHEAFKEDPGFLARFRREAQIVAKLEHPNIIPIYDFNEHEGNPYLVMKFIEGVSLKQRMKEAMLSLEEVLKLLDGVGAGLSYAHKRGILHRDIKPSNVMLDDECTPYIADFGLARITAAGESSLSQDMMLGTPQYMSPEQARGDKSLTISTDIYSLGVMLFELVVGRVPFNADTPYTIVHDHIYTPPPWPSTINPDVPQPVERVLIKALEKNPGDRYLTVKALVEAFKAAVEEAGMEEVAPVVTEKPAHSGISPAADPTEVDRFEAIPVETPLPATAADSLATLPLDLTPAPAARSASLPFEPSVPPVIGVADSGALTLSALRRQQNRHGTAWIMGGCGLLILCCLLFSGGLLSVFNAGIPGSKPPATLKPVVLELPELAGFDIPADPEEFQALLQDTQETAANNPYDPVAQFNLLILNLLNQSDEQRSYNLLNPFVTAAASQPELLLAGVEKLIEFEFDRYAASLAVRALELHPDHRALRETAGAYLWKFSAESGETLLDFYGEIETRITNPLVRTAYARALIEDETTVNYAKALEQLNLALEADVELAEAYLTLGVLYVVTGKPGDALSELEFAITAPNSPAWVKEEAQKTIREYRLRGVAGQPETPTPTPVALALSDKIPDIELPGGSQIPHDLMENAQIAADAYPDNPVAQFTLALLRLRNDPEHYGYDVLLPFLDNTEERPLLVMEASRKLAEYGFDRYAAWLAIEGLERYPDHPALRDAAGAYLWAFASEHGTTLLRSYRGVTANIKNPINHIWYAYALIESGRSALLRVAHRQVNRVLEIDEDLAEVQLALGVLYLMKGADLDAAQEALQYAIDAPGAPQWVREEARRLIQVNELNDS